MEKEEDTGKQRQTLNTDHDKVVFVPAEDIRIIKRVLDHWETVKQEWEKLNT